MNRDYPSYSISLEDKTERQMGDNLCDNNIIISAMPTLQDVLDLIDAHAVKVCDARNAMRQNKGAKTIVLHARLPLGNRAGLCEHKRFSDIPANGDEINELKRRVEAAYKGT